jgi:hypothetical protein
MVLLRSVLVRGLMTLLLSQTIRSASLLEVDDPDELQKRDAVNGNICTTIDLTIRVPPVPTITVVKE